MARLRRLTGNESPGLGRADLGATAIRVSRLCFGTLSLSPLQGGPAAADGGELLYQAWLRGVRFFDTAAIYETYEHLAHLLRRVPRNSVVIASKSYAATADQARTDVRNALASMGTSYVDVFLLHEQESALTLRGHRQALLEFARMRQEGVVRAIGLSTHAVAGVRAGEAEPLVEVIHPLLNVAGLGIVDGDREAMLAATAAAAAAGKGIYSMKALAGGHLGTRAMEALAFVRDIPYIHAVALGMSSLAEIDFAIDVMCRRRPDAALAAQLARVTRRIWIEPWCDGCGECASACSQSAIVVQGGRAVIHTDACIRCGYCAAHCSGFNIKVVSSL